MTDARDRPRLERPESGQQKGSKRREASLCNRVGIGHLSPRARMIRAIARQSSPIVASVEQACHAGGRGFESRLRPNVKRSRKVHQFPHSKSAPFGPGRR